VTYKCESVDRSIDQLGIAIETTSLSVSNALGQMWCWLSSQHNSSQMTKVNWPIGLDAI